MEFESNPCPCIPTPMIPNRTRSLGGVGRVPCPPWARSSSPLPTSDAPAATAPISRNCLRETLLISTVPPVGSLDVRLEGATPAVVAQRACRKAPLTRRSLGTFEGAGGGNDLPSMTWTTSTTGSPLQSLFGAFHGATLH